MVCPRCRNGRLHATGAFHVCDACSLAVTEQALNYEQAMGRSGHGGGGDGQHASGFGARQAGGAGKAGNARTQEP